MPMSEVYPGLQRGVINGGSPAWKGHGNKWHEILKYVNTAMGNGSYIWIVNKSPGPRSRPICKARY